MTPETHGVVEMTRDEVMALLDAQSRRYLDMSAEEFIAAVESGESLPDHPAVEHLKLLLGVE